MSAKFRALDSSQKSESPMQSGDVENEIFTTLSPLKQEEKTVAEISMKDFLDFLKISYQVNEAIENPSPDIAEKVSIDWKKLTADVLINRLKEREAALGIAKSQNSAEEKNEKINYCEQKTVSAGSSKNGTRPNSGKKSIENKLSDEKVTACHATWEKLSTAASCDGKTVSDKVKKSNLGRRKSSGSVRESNSENEVSVPVEGSEDRTPAKALKKKLNEVLQEGIFDSVLPYLLPKQTENSQPGIKKSLTVNDIKKSRNGNVERIDKVTGSFIKEKTESRRKSISKNDMTNKNDKRDSEIVIHVCDEIKNLKRDFRCPQKLLISQMGYFAEVTSGQRLEDMDISVHCDVSIFDWLMRWVQKNNYNQDQWPTLDPVIVIPLLMSSAFLQMDSLQEHCLNYCKSHINEIIRDSPNLSCINDSILTRLANLFSNLETESIVDKKDKIQSKLFCKLIGALIEPEPQLSRGHYSSAATLYRCSKCSKLILRKMSGSIFCLPTNMSLDRNGSVISSHVYDSSWNLTDYVKHLKIDLKTWRRVYWRLWADCHLLYCEACGEYFPVHCMSWCRFHSEPIQYFSVENQRSISYPLGRYPCCGERAFRFEVIKKISGCQYRDHITNPKMPSEVEILRIWNLLKEVIKSEPPPLSPIKFIPMSKEQNGGRMSPVKDVYWWEGLELVPSKQSGGLLTKMWDTVIKKDDSKIAGNNSENKTQKSPNSKSGIQDVSSFSDSSDESCCSSNAGNSEESCHATAKSGLKSKSLTSSHYFSSGRMVYIRRDKRKRKKKKRNIFKNDENRFWLPKLSTRCNQDNQREFEERALRQIELILAKKLSGESFRTSGSTNYKGTPAGGTYIKLERQWREAHCYSHGCPGSSIKAGGSASFVNVNNSGFSVQKRSASRGRPG